MSGQSRGISVVVVLCKIPLPVPKKASRRLVEKHFSKSDLFKIILRPFFLHETRLNCQSFLLIRESAQLCVDVCADHSLSSQGFDTSEEQACRHIRDKRLFITVCETVYSILFFLW